VPKFALNNRAGPCWKTTRTLRVPGPLGYPFTHDDILPSMAKRLVDIDERALAAAKAELGTSTLKDTVNEALRRVAPTRDRRVVRALDRLARARLRDRSAAWR
jgi:Arc/MetJ family transcription regulator